MTLRLFLTVFSFELLAPIYAQNVQILQPLSSALAENSGLAYLDGRLITILDSGGQPALYEIDTLSGNISRTVEISNAMNEDWEALQLDVTDIYIGDFGNNNGNRTNLIIYRISISDYLENENDQASAEAISFSYADQTDFSSMPFESNFDAEAMAVLGDSIYIFTKNWGDSQTKIYSLPKAPGNYEAMLRATINSQGLISGCTLSTNGTSLLLCGYTLVLQPFLLQFNDLTDFPNNASIFSRAGFTVTSSYSAQVEGITAADSGYFLASEANFFGSAGLFRIYGDDVLSVEVIEGQGFMRIFPNPSADWVKVELPELHRIEVYTAQGGKHLQTKDTGFDINTWPAGMYIVKCYNKQNRQIGTGKLIRR